MNKPFDRVHDDTYSYGWLVLPWFGGWIAIREQNRELRGYRPQRNEVGNGPELRLFRRFHNCTATGVY